MNRNLLNRAIVVGVVVFTATFLFELMTMSRGEFMPAARSGGPASPIELIEHAIEGDELDHRLWDRVSQAILREPDPIAALADLDQRINPDANRAGAISAYTAYYTGYRLMQRGDTERAQDAWEFALDRFRAWGNVSRPHLEHNDTVYLARTLMRLKRDSEAFEALRSVPGVLDGTPSSLSAAILLARTLAEIERAPLAVEVLTAALTSRPPNGLRRDLAALTSESARWGRTGEPEAMRAAQIATGRAFARLLADAGGFDEDLYRAVRNNALTLASAGEAAQGAEIASAAAAAARRVAQRTQRDGAWLWAAKFHAIAGEPAAAARAIAGAEPASLRPEDLVNDWDLRPLMGREDMRTSVLLHGEPDEWAKNESSP